ncbi:MAG: dTMP kinase [Deltaproteobacteria bacterium]|nr:dTMP kinase [Deltaproteobacteria bacterium]
MSKAKLIVFEGVDGSGTTTQVARLQQRLVKENIPACKTAQPSERPTGKMIREILAGRLIQNPGFATMSLLFAADRQDQQESEILPCLYRGESVICDRYVHSSVIYQSLSAQDPSIRTWIKEVNRHIMVPHQVIYLRIDAKTAAQRRAERGGDEEIFDKMPFQQRLVDTYDSIQRIFPNHRIATIDATQSIEQIEEEVWGVVEPMYRK